MMEMNKSVYSLVLSDRVVSMVDDMAYRMGTSRSNLINQILAEYVSLTTPEKRMKDIFEQMSELLLSDGYQIQSQPSDSMLSVKSVLRYKYKPTIRYSVELYRNFDEAFGEIRVVSRTQSQGLIEILESFYEIWARIESMRQRGAAITSASFKIENGRYLRQFIISDDYRNLSEDAIGKAIAEYVRCFDSAIKEYFTDFDAAEVQKIYNHYLVSTEIIL